MLIAGQIHLYYSEIQIPYTCPYTGNIQNQDNLVYTTEYELVDHLNTSLLFIRILVQTLMTPTQPFEDRTHFKQMLN